MFDRHIAVIARDKSLADTTCKQARRMSRAQRSTTRGIVPATAHLFVRSYAELLAWTVVFAISPFLSLMTEIAWPRWPMSVPLCASLSRSECWKRSCESAMLCVRTAIGVERHSAEGGASSRVTVLSRCPTYRSAEGLITNASRV